MNDIASAIDEVRSQLAIIARLARTPPPSPVQSPKVYVEGPDSDGHWQVWAGPKLVCWSSDKDDANEFADNLRSGFIAHWPSRVAAVEERPKCDAYNCREAADSHWCAAHGDPFEDPEVQAVMRDAAWAERTCSALMTAGLAECERLRANIEANRKAATKYREWCVRQTLSQAEQECEESFDSYAALRMVENAEGARDCLERIRRIRARSEREAGPSIRRIPRHEAGVRTNVHPEREAGKCATCKGYGSEQWLDPQTGALVTRYGSCPDCKGTGRAGGGETSGDPTPGGTSDGSGKASRAADGPTEPRTSFVVGHVYTSTACRHELHDDCRETCKFCDAKCRCYCHVGSAGGGERGTQVQPDDASRPVGSTSNLRGDAGARGDKPGETGTNSPAVEDVVRVEKLGSECYALDCVCAQCTTQCAEAGVKRCEFGDPTTWGGKPSVCECR